MTNSGHFREFCYFLYRNRRWWVMPLIVALLLVGMLMVLSRPAATPFVYRIF